MQQTIQMGQVAQPSVLSHVRAFVKNQTQVKAAAVRKWWAAESKTFSQLCATEEGETFTHGQVVLANAGAVALVVLCMVAEWLEGGAI